MVTSKKTFLFQADSFKALAVACALLVNMAACAQTATPPSCQPDKKYDTVLSGAMPPNEKACREEWYANEQSICTPATFKKDWTNFVMLRRVRLEAFENQLAAITGGNEVATGEALGRWATGGWRALSQGLKLTPSACVSKRKTVPTMLMDFELLSLQFDTWANSYVLLVKTQNSALYAADVACEEKQLRYTIGKLKYLLEQQQHAPKQPKSCN